MKKTYPPEYYSKATKKYNASPKGKAKRAEWINANREKLREYNKQYLKQRSQQAKKQGICTHCYKKPKTKKTQLCNECKEKSRQYQEQLRTKKMNKHPTSIPSIIWCEKCDKTAGIINYKKKILCLNCYNEENPELP